MKKRKLVLNSYEDFEDHLRNCIQWDSTADGGQYDLIGITGLLSALLDNLDDNNTHSSQLAEIKEVLTIKNTTFLKALLNTKEQDE